jgi:hypothetical protein
MGETLGRSVRAVRSREGVVDVDVAILCQLLGKTGIVLLLARVEAGVLEDEHVAVLHTLDRFGGFITDAIVGKGDRPAELLAKGFGDRLQRLLRIAPFGPAEMRQDDRLAALRRDFADGRQDTLDAGRVGDPPVLGGHVEVEAEEDPLAADVDLVERADLHCSRP